MSSTRPHFDAVFAGVARRPAAFLYVAVSRRLCAFPGSESPCFAGTRF